MNKKGANLPVIMLVILLIVVAIVLFFVFYNSQNSNTKAIASKIKDCGMDMDCFIDAAKNCQKAKIIFTSKINLFGIEQTTSSYYEIKGMQSDKCLFYLRTESVDLQFSDALIQQMKNGGASQVEIDKQLQESQNSAKLLEGRDGICNIETQKLATLLSKWKQGSFSTEDFKNVDCNGKYFESKF